MGWASVQPQKIMPKIERRAKKEMSEGCYVSEKKTVRSGGFFCKEWLAKRAPTKVQRGMSRGVLFWLSPSVSGQVSHGLEPGGEDSAGLMPASDYPCQGIHVLPRNLRLTSLLPRVSEDAGVEPIIGTGVASSCPFGTGS